MTDLSSRPPITLAEALLLLNPEAKLLEPREVYDDCIVGLAASHPADRWRAMRPSGPDAGVVAIYDVSRLLDRLASGADTEEEYLEVSDHVDQNLGGAWQGPGTPIVVLWDGEEPFED